MELHEFAKELREARESDRTEAREDKEKLHGRIDDLGTTMNSIDKKTVHIEGKVNTLASVQGTQGTEIDRLRIAKGSPSPEGPNSVRRVNDRVNEQSWRKIGALIGGTIAALSIPAVVVGSSISSQTDAVAAQGEQLQVVTRQQKTVVEQGEVSQADRIAALQAALAASKAQNQSARALATLDAEDSEKAVAENKEATKVIARAVKEMEQRKMAAAVEE